MEQITCKVVLRKKPLSYKFEPQYRNWNLSAECFLAEGSCYKYSDFARIMLEIQMNWDYNNRRVDLNEIPGVTQYVGIVGQNKRFPEKGIYWFPGLEKSNTMLDEKRPWKGTACLTDIRKKILQRKIYKANMYKLFDRDLFERTMFKWSHSGVDNSIRSMDKVKIYIYDTAEPPAKVYKNWTSDLELLTYHRWYKLNTFWEQFKQYWNSKHLRIDNLKETLCKIEEDRLVSETKRFPAEGIYISEFLSGDKVTKLFKKLKVFIVKYKGRIDVKRPSFMNELRDLFVDVNIRHSKIKLFDRNTFESEFGLLAVE